MREEIRTDRTAEEIFSIFRDEPYAVFLDSSLQHETLGKYSILLFDPFLLFSSKNNRIDIVKDNRSESCVGDPLLQLKNLLEKYQAKPSRESLPCEKGCAVGFISYDFGSVLEKLPDTTVEDMDIPHMMFGFYDSAIVVDHGSGKTYICAGEQGKIDRIRERILQSGVIQSPKQSPKQSPMTSLNQDLIPDPKTDPKTDPKQSLKPTAAFKDELQANPAPAAFLSDFNQAEYSAMVEKAREYIRDGDIFQVNLSRRVRTNLQGDAYEVYRRLRYKSPAPFACYLHFGDLRIMSSSPERFFHLADGRIETRPIKGTRPRGQSEEEDLALREELLGSEKDLAELVMIVDLERNDLGRICKMGTVEVTKLVELETYANVFHLVATIRGELSEGMDVTDCIRATFPGGSITGAPKIRAMEIIDELEPVKRNIYTGAIGYMGFDGVSDFNIAIRTIVADKSQAYYQVGGGIVWDSVPEKEYAETIDKGSAMQRILEEDDMVNELDRGQTTYPPEYPPQCPPEYPPQCPPACIADTDQGFLFGLSLFETFLVQANGTVLFLEDHADRLMRSARALGFDLSFTAESWMESVLQYMADQGLKSRILRVTVSSGSRKDIAPSIHFSVRDFDEQSPDYGYKLTVSDICRNETSLLTAHKTGNYAENLLVLRDAAAKGFDDALFLNSRGKIAETTKCNFFFVKENVIYTPAPACGLLPGIIRKFVIERASALGIPLIDGEYTLDDISSAEEVFVTNSVMGIQPVFLIQKEAAGNACFTAASVGRITELFRKEYNKLSKQTNIQEDYI